MWQIQTYILGVIRDQSADCEVSEKQEDLCTSLTAKHLVILGERVLGVIAFRSPHSKLKERKEEKGVGPKNRQNIMRMQERHSTKESPSTVLCAKIIVVCLLLKRTAHHLKLLLCCLQNFVL